MTTASKHTGRPTEAEYQRTIIEAAKLLGWHVHAARPAQNSKGGWRTPIQGHRGLPDLILVRGQQLWFIELKRKPNKVEPDQQRWLDVLANAGAHTAVIWVPDGMDAFIAELAKPEGGST